MTALASRVQPLASPSSRLLSRGLIGGILAYGLIRAYLWLQDWPHVVALFTSADHAIYMAQAHRVLAGGPLYPAYELAGPFVAAQLPQLYPPPTVYGLFVPMSLLPDFLWWVIPLTAIAAVVTYHRPSAWGWVAILALLIVVPSTWTVIAAGNPAIWVAAGMALATIRRPFALAALIKPTMIPFAAFGVRSRGFWIGLAVYCALAVLMFSAWIDYAHVLANYRASVLVIEVPLILVPLVAWWTRAVR